MERWRSLTDNVPGSGHLLIHADNLECMIKCKLLQSYNYKDFVVIFNDDLSPYLFQQC